MTECNLKSELTLEKVDTILNRLLQDNETNPNPVRNEAIKHYNKLKLSILEGR